MSKDKLSDYDGTTAGNNTDIGGISIAEGMLPSAVNNSMRELTRQLGAFANGTEAVAQINFGDNDKAVFGAGSDLQISHTGTYSLIADTSGTGPLRVVTNQFQLNNAADTANLFKAIEGGAVTAYHNGSARLATSASGIDVTGSVTADGLTVDDGVQTNVQIGNVGQNNNPAINIGRNDTSITGGNPLGYVQFLGADNTAGSLTAHAYIAAIAQSGHSAGSNPTEIVIGTTDGGSETITNRVKVGHNGDISFYDSTGTTQGLFWDASTQRLGLGTTGPTNPLHISSSAGEAILISNSSASGNSQIKLDGATDFQIGTGQASSGFANKLFIYDATNAATRMVITNGGNVGIGTSSPTAKLELNKGSAGSLATFTDGISTNFNFSTSGTVGSFGTDAGSTSLALKTAGSERMRITSGGAVGIGTSAPSGGVQLDVRGSGVLQLVNSDNVQLVASNGGSTLKNVSNNPLIFGTNNTERMRITSGGNVGIGTSSPTIDSSLAGLSVNASGTLLHVNDGDGATLKLTDPATGANRGLGITLQGTSAAISNCESGDLRFGTSNTERMRISSDGNITGTRFFMQFPPSTPIANSSGSEVTYYQNGALTSTDGSLINSVVPQAMQVLKMRLYVNSALSGGGARVYVVKNGTIITGTNKEIDVTTGTSAFEANAVDTNFAAGDRIGIQVTLENGATAAWYHVVLLCKLT